MAIAKSSSSLFSVVRFAGFARRIDPTPCASSPFQVFWIPAMPLAGLDGEPVFRDLPDFAEEFDSAWRHFDPGQGSASPVLLE
jgi:hypothetical protein